MKNGKITLGISIALLTFGIMVFAACDNGMTGGGEDMQVYNDDLTTFFTGSGNVKIEWQNSSHADIEKSAGTVTGGIISLNLPSINDADLFTADFDSAVTVTPPDVKGLECGAFILYEAGETDPAGEILQFKLVSSDEFYTIEYWYFNESVTIDGTYTDIDSGVEKTYTISASPGWNKILGHIVLDSAQAKEYITHTSNLRNAPSDIKWVFSPIDP